MQLDLRELHPLAWSALFVFVWLPLVPVAAAFFAILSAPWLSVPGILLGCLGARLNNAQTAAATLEKSAPAAPAPDPSTHDETMKKRYARLATDMRLGEDLP
jgi:hypothetical protein